MKKKWIFLNFIYLSSLLNAKIEFSHQTDPYRTHQPILYEMAMRTNGPIIEFGCGHGSTDLLHEICIKEKRLLISLDDNLEWLNLFKEKYQEDSDWHKFIFIEGKPAQDSDDPHHWIEFLHTFDLLKTSQFDLCFIDQHPWDARTATLNYMKDKAKFILLHDCDYFPTQGIFGTTILPSATYRPGIFDFSDVFPYFKVYFPSTAWPGPPTLLGSYFESDLPEIDFNAY